MPSTSSLVPLAQRALAIRPSATLAMVGRVQELRARGVQIWDLTAGEPNFRPPKAAEQAGAKAIQEGRGRYTAAAGMAELRAEAAAMARRELGLEYRPEEIVVTPGAKIALCQALLALVNPGDRVLFPAPFWTSYPDMVRLAGGEPVAVPSGADLLPDLAALEAARDQRTRALLLNTPCNPTGMVYPAGLLRDVGAWCLEHGIAVISDEIYAALTFDGVKHVSPIAAAPGLHDQSVWVGGISKAYAMTGWRIGFLGAPARIATAIANLQSQLASCPPAISQLASLAALREGAGEREEMRRAFEQRCRLVSTALNQMPGIECPQPQGAFYAFPRLGRHLGKTDPASGRRIQSGADFTELLLEQDRVAVLAGNDFGAPDAFRISFAASEEVLQEALQRIASRLAALR